MSPNEAWKIASEICQESGKGVLGTKEANQKPLTSKEVQELSSKQKKLRDEAESSQNKWRRQQLKKEKDKILDILRNQFKFEKIAEIDEELKEMKVYKDNPIKYYQAMRKVNSKKPKKRLEIYDDIFNLITWEEDQIFKITEFFDDLFLSDETQISVTPEKMEPSFTLEEIQKASKSLKTIRQQGLMELMRNTWNIDRMNYL